MSTYTSFFRSSTTIWSLLNKAPESPVSDDSEIEQEVPATKADADCQLSTLLQERMNSSKQLPGLARIHNEHQQDLPSLQLLSMPDKIVEKALRFALVDSKAICVDAAHPKESNEKARAVLSVCHRLRELGRPIFYHENIFEVKVARFDIKAVLPWLKVADTFLSEAETAVDVSMSNGAEVKSINTDSTMDVDLAHPTILNTVDSEITQSAAAPSEAGFSRFGKPSRQVVKIFSNSFNHFVNPVTNLDKAKPATHNQLKMLAYFLGRRLEQTLIPEAPLPGEVYFVPAYEPHWANLVEWMKLYHEGEVARYAYEKGDPNGSAAVQSMFDLVQIEKEEGKNWSAFEGKLYALRGFLAATKEGKGWLED